MQIHSYRSSDPRAVPGSVLAQSDHGPVFGAGRVDNAVPDPGLPSWWPMDENGDAIVDGNPGALVNGPVFTGGKVGNALSFDGVNDHVTISTGPNLVGARAVMMTAWSKSAPGQGAGSARIFEVGPSGADSTALMFHVPTNSVDGWDHSGGSRHGQLTSISDGVDYQDNQWHFVAYTGALAQLYVDGVLKGSLADSGAIDGPPTAMIGQLGYSAPNPVHVFDGLLVEISVYSAVSSAEQIRGEYAAGNLGKCQSQPPTAVCQDIAVELGAAGSVVVNAAAVDNGSRVADGDTLSFLIDSQPSLTFTCAELGANAVTSSVDDGNGGSDQCPATIAVVRAGDCVATRLFVLTRICESAAELGDLDDAVAAVDQAIADFLDGGTIGDQTAAQCGTAILQELGWRLDQWQ